MAAATQEGAEVTLPTQVTVATGEACHTWEEGAEGDTRPPPTKAQEVSSIGNNLVRL